jgi:uncharacterized protein (TIGR02099 family)
VGSIQASNIALRKQYEKDKALYINTLETAFNLLKQEGGWVLSVDDLLLESNNNKWPSASFSLATDHSLSQISASITQLDLQELTELMQFFTPLDFSEHGVIKKLHLQGELKNSAVFIDNQNNNFAVNGTFNNIFIRAFEGFPEIQNLTGSITGSNEQGFVRFNTNKGHLFFSELFRNSFTIEQFIGQLEWQQLDDTWRLSSENLVLNTKDVEIETKFRVNIPKNEASVFMNLQASFSNMNDISRISEYYPASMMDEDVVEWLDRAFLSGQIEQGNVLVYGELDKFPFVDNQGVFEVLYDMKNVELQYNSDWPNLTHVNAEVLFFKNSVSIDLSHALTNNLRIKQTLLEIPSFADSDHLLVNGKIEGAIMDGLHFLQKTPIHGTADSVLNAITPAGLAQVDLDLKIPLAEAVEVSAKVIAHLSKASLKVNAVDIDVTEITGDLSFTEDDFFCKNVTANTLGYPVKIQANSNQARTLISLAGRTDITHLEQQFDFFDSWILKGQRLKGATDYELKLDLPVDDNKPTGLIVRSDLLGISVDFPETLKKTAEQSSSLILSMSLDETEVLPLSLRYQDDLGVAMNIDKNTNEMLSANIIYGEGQKTTSQLQNIATNNRGIKIQVERDKLDATQWMDFIKHKETKNDTESVELNKINLVTKQLHWKNKTYGSFELAMHRLSGKWQGNITSAMAKGAFIIPLEETEKEAIKLNMAHLNLSELMQIDFQKDNVSVETLPLVDVVSEQLLWKNSNLGRLKIRTERLVDGIRFNKIDIDSSKYKVELKADWIKADKSYITDMYGSIKADNFGKFLKKFNVDNDFKSSEGQVEFFAVWPGSPYQFSLEGMEAEMDIELKNGRLANIEPGFGRVLGLIAMEQWLKRLTFEFGDIYKQGLSFNNITGHFKIMKGNAMTRNLLVDAVPAQIFITGDADLIAQTFDHRMGVVPKSSAALPIAGTIVSGIAGVITQAFTNEYKEGYFFGSQYKVQGSWDNLQVTPIHEEDGILKKTWTGLTDFSWMNTIAE